MWASYPCFQLCLVFGIIYPEVIVASFLYSVSYRAHRGATVAVFVSGLKRGTRQRQAQGSNASHSSIQASLVVWFLIVSLTSNSTFPHAPCCTHSPELLSHPPVVVAGSSFPNE